MRISRCIFLALVGASLSLSQLAPPALAGAPATVTVRVEGAAATLLPPTQVTTTTVPVEKEGHSCSGTSAAGALQLATTGNWSGHWYDEGGFFVETIESESFVKSPSGYWSFWLDNKEATKGICESELEPGDSILFFPECFGECPARPNPLGIEAPTVAEVGQPVKVAVTSYANPSGAPSASSGATVGYESANAITDSSGHATLIFSHSGSMIVRVTAPQSIRTETTICVHAGNDGNCGTHVTGSSGATGSGTTPVTPTPSSSTAITARISSPQDGHAYARRKAPRILAGVITTTAPLQAVELRLTRRGPKGRCSYFDGLIGRFRAMRCGAANGKYFKASSQKLFSYLLPEALAPGRYVLDVLGMGAGGHLSSLVRGASRIVFYVK
jgi:hypothetical protein